MIEKFKELLKAGQLKEAEKLIEESQLSDSEALELLIVVFNAQLDIIPKAFEKIG